MHESKPPSDALVFFGATGDLAYKKIFPALQSLTRRGRLNVPVIGVAFSGWNRDQLIARAKASCTEYGGLDPAAFEKLSSAVSCTGLTSIEIWNEEAAVWIE
jgi:glucose-6-phosphate 1-dehydrogenase